MKRYFFIIIAVLVSITSYSCPKPTGHCVFNVGASYYLNNLVDITHGVDNLGVDFSLGYETPKRFHTIGVSGTYVVNQKLLRIGGEYKLNPLGVAYGYDTPVNFSFILGVGYSTNKYAYSDFGLELSGRMGSVVTFYINDKVGVDYSLDTNNGTIHNTINVGLRFWIGRGW